MAIKSHRVGKEEKFHFDTTINPKEPLEITTLEDELQQWVDK